jgi:Ca2+-dependent lipid-binding protein
MHCPYLFCPLELRNLLKLKPEHESAEWLNIFIRKLWPYLNSSLSKSLRTSTNGMMERYFANNPSSLIVRCRILEGLLALSY